MSKIGKLPVAVPQGVVVAVQDNDITISGPKGESTYKFRPEIAVESDGSTIKVLRQNDTKLAKSLHGLTRSLIANMIKGVTDGHTKELELVGVGYRASKQGEDLVLNVGYSHPVLVKSPKNIEIETKDSKIIVSGVDKTQVGQIAATIRRVRPPEPYKGKGIKYIGEHIRRKAGKALKSAQ